MYQNLPSPQKLQRTKNLFKKTFTIFSLTTMILGGIVSMSIVIGNSSIKSQAAGTPNYTTSNKKFFKDGQEIVFKGVNWFGFETDNAVFHGLWTNRSANTQLDQMKSLGFNTIRLPVCPGVLTNKNIGGVDFSANPDLNGLNSQQALDLMMQKISAKGMYILLDHHRPDCNAISEYWYTGSYSETQWINDLKTLATRYASNPNFMGIDIKNEPHGAVTWNEWKGATERAGQAILAVNPNIVIYTEGVSTTNPGGNCNSSYNAWWGGNIKGQLCDPISASAIPSNKLAFAPHVYGPDVYGQPYFNDPSFANMPAIWDDHFGNVLAAGYSVALGEFGGKYGAGDSRDVAWQNKVVDYQIAKGMCSFFFWSWNPNSGDTGGILNDDWTTVSTAKYNNLKRLIDAPNCQGGEVVSSSLPNSSSSINSSLPSSQMSSVSNSSSSSVSSTATSVISSQGVSSLASPSTASTQSSIASTPASQITGTLKVKLNLQGAYNTTTNTMRTDLKTKNLVSNDNPYDDSLLPGFIPIDVPNAVDWVGITVQNTANPSMISFDSGALLLSDGSLIMDPRIGGASNNTRTLQPGKYKVTVKHRNHLAISTNTDIDIVAGQNTMLDFTTNQNVKGGNQALIKPGVYGLKMGNTDSNNRINSIDRIVLRMSSDRINVASNLDINMDGNISSIDRILSRSTGDSVAQL